MRGASARASATGARRLTSSIRSICSWLSSVSIPLAGSAAFATSTSTSAGRLGGEPFHLVAVAPGRSQTARPPTSEASGSSTSARRPLSDQARHRGRRSARAIACPIPPVAPVTRTVPVIDDGRHACGVTHRPTSCGNTATVAVKPCRKLRPPTGSDLAGGEETGRRSSAQLPVHDGGVVVGRAEHRTAAPVAGEQQRAGQALVPSIASALRRSARRRSSSAELASRTCSRTTCPS